MIQQKKLLKVIAEENEKVKKTQNGNDEIDVQPTPSFFPRNFFIFFYQSPSSSGISSPFQQNQVTAERKGNPENQVSLYNMLQTAPSSAYNPT